MESSMSKALIMVAGVLLAMIVIVLVTISFRKMGSWVEEADQEKLIEQVQKFNKEYEAYDKDLMYGVDVISCLNKAKSNNDKIDGDYAEAVDKGYEVRVSVDITGKDLEEAIIVYATKDGSKEEETSNWDSGYKLKNMNPKFSFDLSKSKFDDNTILKTQYEISKMKKGKYELTYRKNGLNESILREQLNLINSGDLSETVKNKETKAQDNMVWTRATYRSALYDLKTRKFTCTNIGYDSKTGRVNQIDFQEKK